MTEVYSGSLDGTQPTITVTFTTPFTYTGGNLLLEVTNETKGTWKSAQFYGVSATGASVQGHSSTSVASVAATQRNFIPKTTFTYTPGGSGPICIDPTGLTASGETSDGATVSWTAPAAGESPLSYQVCCLPATATFDAATANWVAATGTTSHTFTGLNASTQYTAHVRSVCGSDFYSNGNASVNFNTACSSLTLPFNETFDASSSTRNCWNLVSMNTGNTIGTYYGMGFYTVEGREVLRFSSYSNHGGSNDYNQYGFSPLLDVSPTAAFLSVSVTFATYNSDNKLYFGYVTPTDTVWDPTEYTTTGSTDWQTQTFVIPVTATHLAVNYYGDYSFYAWIDNVSITEQTCSSPTGLHASVTTDEATIGWTEVSGNHLGYQAEWDDSALPGLSGNPFSFTGLSPASTHTVRVRTICAAGDTSDWSTPLTFTMECASVNTYPYIEGFENSASIPACWKSIDGDGDDRNWSIMQDTDGDVLEGEEPTTGNNYIASASFNYSTYSPLTPNNWLISPSFTLPTPCNLSLVWYAKSEEPPYLESLDLLLSTTGSDTAAFTTPVLSLANIPGEYTQYVYPLANYAGQTVQFAFVHRNVSGKSIVNLDNVGILEIPQVVTNDATNIDIYTASLNGSVTGQALTAFGFEWKASADSDYERDTVAIGNHTGSISFNLANLDPVTSYTFRTFAAVEGIIFYGDEKTFTTDQLPCPSPANLTVSNVDHESATVTWTSQLPTVGSYNVYLDNTLLNQTPVSALTYPLTGLNPGTSYEVRVVTVCEGTEGLFDTKTFSTPCIRVGCFAIGDTNSTSSYYWLPVNTYYNYSYTQQLFLASEMGSANLITNIAFKYAYSSPTTKLTNVKIYMGHTTKDVFASNTDTVPFADLTEVYSGNLNCSQGWNTFELDQPFSYNGTDNLVLALFDNVYGYDGNLYQFVCATAGGDRALDYYSDSQVPNPANLSSYTGGKGIRSFRNVVKFGYCDNSTCVPPTVSVDNVTAHDAEVSWTPGYQESAWGMQYKGENDNDWTTVTLTPNSANPYTLTNLAANTNYTVQMWSLCGNNEVSEITEKTFTTLVSCPAPTTLASTTVTATDATLTWTSVGTPGSFEVEYNDGENTFSTVVNAVSTTMQQTTTLTGLSANTAYTVRVRAICGVNDLSTWSNTASFTTLISCPSPTVPVVLDKTANSATISWTPGGTEGEWDVYYSWASPTDPTLQEGSTTYTITATSYTFTGLNANTTYSAHVRAVCGNGDVSDYVDVQFTTPCGTVSVPYTENFDSYTQGIATSTSSPTGYPAVDMPACWTFLNNATTTSTYPIAFLTSLSTYAVAGNCLFFKSSYATPIYAVLPEMSENLSELQLTFTYRNEGVSISNGTLHVGYMTNLADVSTYVEMYSCSQTTTKTEVEVNFNTVTVTPGTPYYIVFKYEGGSSNAYYLGIDNVSVDYIPACPAPTSLAASNETADGATLTWTAVGTPSSFEVEYSDGENTFSTVVNANPTTTQQTTTLTGLSSITDYTVRVRAICGVGDTSAWSNTASFTTACAVFTAPYTEDFTGFNTLVSACWKRYSGAASSPTTSTSDLTVITSNTTGWIFNNQNVFGLGHAKLNIYGTIKNWLVTPAIDISTLTNPELTFDLALTAYNSTNPVSSSTTQADDKFIVFISTDNGATWSMNNATVWDNAGGNYVYNNISSTGERISIPLNQYAGQTIKIAFYGESTVNNNGDNDVHIDNVSVDERPSCPVPTGVTVPNVTATSATLTWTPGGNESAWDIYVPSSSADVPVVNSDNMHSVTATSYTVSNLPSNSICTLYVRANCGNEESDWVSKTFTTPCGTVNIPYTEDFDSYSSSEYPTCWSRYPNTYSSSTNYPIINPNSAHSGSNSLYMYSGTGSYYMAILPELNLDGMAMSDLWVTFYYSFNKGSYANAAGKMIVGVMTDPTDLNSFYPVDTVEHTAPTTWELQKVYLTNYTGNGRYIAFKNLTTASYAGYFIDDVTVEPIPSCLAPTGLTTEIVTATEIMFSVTGTNNVQGYQVEYGATGFAHGQGSFVYEAAAATASQTLIVIDYLTANTTYDFYVRAICGGNDTSAWSPVTTEKTLCNVISNFPWTETFNDLTAGIPDCWDNTEGTTTNAYHRWNYHATGQDGACLRYNSYNATIGQTNMLKTPVLNLGNLTNPQLTFSYKNPAGGDFSVYLSTDGGATYTTPIATGLTGISSWTGAVYILDALLANVSDKSRVVIVFQATSNYGNGDAFIYLDNVTVEEAPTCPVPMALTVEDVTNTEMMFSVNGSGNVLGYQVEYGATGFAHGHGSFVYEAAAATTSQTLIVIDNLTANTTYDFYVRAICGVGDTSAWSPVTTEKTLCDVVSSFPWSENFDAVSVNTLPDCWTNTNDVGSTSWKVTNSINGSISAHSGSNVMRFYYSGNESDQSSLQMPTFNLTSLNSPMIGFWYTNKEWGGDQDEMTVYYRTSPTDTWTLLASYTDNVAAWTYDSLALPNPSATYQIKFVGLTNYGFGINLDDIVIKEMPITVCSAPTDVTVSDITASTAEVNWTNNANLTYELQYRTAGTAPQTVDTNITTTALAAANNLINDNNIGSGTIDANISYTGIQNGGSNAPKYYTSGQNIRLYSNTSGNGNGGSIKLTPSNGAVITGLDITTSGSSYTPSVSYSVDGGTSATATLSGLVYTISGISAATSLEFQNTNTNSSNTQLRITQMTIHYTLPGTDDAWTTIVPATSPTVLSNLDPETGYEVQVRTICAVGDTSDWSSVVPFSTEEFICGAPVKLSVNDITMNSAEVIWSDDGTYPTELQYMANGTPDQYVDNTFDFSQQGYANAQTFDGVTVNIDNNITFVAHKNSGSNAPAYYVNDNTFRVYAQNSFSVTAVNGAVITGIEIDANSNHPNLNWSADGGQSSSINGTSSHYDIPITAANTVTVTNPASSGNQLRMETLTVHYTIPGTAGTWTSMANVTSPVLLTGLMPNTNYSVRLRNICSASDTSVWTSTDFTTLTCPPITKSITAEACGSYTWDGTPYTTSGDYTKTYTLATGCDSVVTLHLTIHNPTHASITDTACGTYTWVANNNTVYTQSGTYTYSHQDANGCTQVDTLHLTVFHPTHVAYTESACGTYTWNNTEYTQSGTYTYPHQDANGCTQVDTLHLTIHNPTHVAYTESACGSYTWNNTEYTQSGTYTYPHQDANGCTQVDTLHLTINPIPVVTVTGDAAIALYESATLTASGASTYVWNTGETAQTITVTPASIGNHSYIVVGTSEFSCQSAPDTFVVEVGACRPGVSTETVTACDSYTWHGVTYTQSTNNATYRIANGAASGCDSVITLHLTILNKVLNEFSASNCVSYEWNGQVYTASGDYTQTFPAANGCDSIVTLHLTIKQPVTYAFATTVCGSYTWVDQTYNTSGIYTRTFQAANGCDSIVTLNLTVKQPVSTSISATACGSYTWNNEVYTTNGEYVQTFQAANGCDSVVILTLTINPVYDLNVDMPICKAALPYAWRDTLFGVGTQSGTYVFHRQTAAGCDSTVTLHLVVNDAIATEVTETGCESYTWNNQVYTTSGNYVQVLQTAAGCDSTVTLHLTINNPTHQAFTEVACGSYTWNNTEYTASGDYTFAHTDANGCTQVDTLHLTIKPVPVVTITSDPALPIIEYGESATLTASGADSYVWNTQQTSSTITVAPRVTNSYFVVGTTDGCVSDTVNITVTVGACQLILNEFSATGCHSYNWNGTVYTTSGDYQQHLYNDLGCDSVVTLHLTIYPNQGVARTVDACGSYTWYQQHFTQSGTYTFAYYDGNGCIQEDTLYLTIHNPVHESLNIVSCGPYMWNNTEYTQDGTYTYTHEDAHGCTQVDTLHLTIKPVPVVTVSSNNTQIVQHESTTLTASGATSYVWSNQATGATVTVTPMQTTTYSVVGTVDGCASEPDSITVYVTPCTPAEGVFTVTACDRYVWYGTTYTESTNTATHTIQRPGICDSIVTLHLTILHPVAEIINITACERYTWHNTTFTQSGRYTYSHQDANGCTQVDTLYLTILRPTHTAVTVSECNGFVWHNIEYTQSGTYTFAHEDVHGCTQVDTLYLTIFHPAHTAYNVDACGSYVWNNTEYTQSGTYTYRHRDANGCQQIDTLHLTIHHPVAQSYEAVACESYTWNNTVYTQSGTYTYAHEDAHGCMQVDTLRLTIHNAVAESFEAEACESYTWNNTVYTQSGTYTFAHADVNGCTQVDTLHLTIYNAVAEVYEAEACESYVWNNTEYTQSGTYTYAHEDIHGCTQVDTLHLIINNPTHTAVTESACGSYTWNNTEYTQSGTYTFAHADANGCTQVDTLHLTIFQPAVTEFSDNACGSYYWNNVYYNESGDYVQHFQTVDGCDSTVTLHLTIYPRAEVAGVVGDTLIHEYESATLTAIALNGNPFWVGFGQTASITVAPMTTTTYTVMAVSEHCASAPVRVKVTVLPCIPVQGVETVTACESYEWHGVTYTESTNTPTFTIERQGVCDSVVTLHLTIFNPTHVAYTESACGSYVWNNTEYTQSGTYTYTHTDANGCTQVDTLHLTINNPVAATYEAEACGSYTWNNTEYTQSGTYTFTHLDANGCTQVDTLHLTIHNPTHVAYTESACGSYVWNNTEYTQSGTYTFAHADVNDCTQVDTLHLTIHNPTHVAYTESACGSYVWNNTEYTQSGTYTFAHADVNGCTQVDTLHLTILNAVHEAFTVSECNAYTWHGTTYTQSGDYTYIHSDANGCTKVDTLHLTIFHPQPNVYTLTACGDYVWHGTVYTQTGVYTYTTTDINGCTQVDTLYLTVNRPQNTSSVAEACGSYMWRGNTYTQSGVYVKAVQNNFGCMYLDTLYLTIHQPLTQIVEATACESYTWNNVTYTQSGHYVQNFQTMFGCDSTVTLNLTVNHPQHQSVTVGECGPYTWHGTTYSQSGVYTYVHSDANGCTQVDTLHLIIYQPRHQSLLITECESFTWGGTTYTQSGVYTYAHPDNHGCTQVDTLYLTINHPTGTSITVTECEMYDWNGFIYTQSGTYTQSHLDANGCTQVDTLRLTIYHPVHQSVTVTECFEYTWHGTTYNFSGVYTYTHLDNHGCTQVDTLHLTIHHPQSSTITVDACGSYQWYGTNYTQSGVYTHNVTGTYGCQVKDTLILHIHQPVSTQFSARACSYYVWDGTVYTQSGDYVKHYYTQWGCDSTVTLHLDIHQPQSSEFTIVTENSCYTWNGVEYCQNGTYMQQFEDSYGCDSVVTLHLTLRVGVEDYDGYAVSLYPNPTTGVAYVEVSGDEMERVEVYDSYGKLLQTRNVSGNVAQIELSAYAKGVYHVRVTTTKGVVTKRVVKN